MNHSNLFKFLHVLCILVLSNFYFGTHAFAAIDSKGTEFFFSFAKNVSPHQPEVLITSETDANGTVEVQGLNFVQAFSVNAGDVISIALPSSVETSLPGKGNTGIRIASDSEITVYGLNVSPATTDAFLALPVDALGVEYIALGYPTYDSRFPPQAVITGLYDGTEITITPSELVLLEPGIGTSRPHTITLNRNENYYIVGQTDLTGTIIRSSAPISVNSGNMCNNVPGGVGYCDHLVEMLPPVTAWGRSFLTVPLETRTRGDIFRVLASEDNTIITINNQQVATINRGEAYETFLTDESKIDASSPVLLAQFSVGTRYDGVLGDPFMMLIPPTTQFLDRYNFSNIGVEHDFQNSFVNVVIPSSHTGSVNLDGSLVDSGLFVPISDSGYSGAKITTTPGQHNINSTVPFGIYAYGFGLYNSYGYTGGASFEIINPPNDQFFPNVNLVAIDDEIQGVAEDSEDININGILDAGEDLNLNGTIDARSEDINSNGILDSGEDINGDGAIGHDTGINIIALSADSINLELTTNNFIPGASRAEFTIRRININASGTGVLTIGDGAGNKITRNIAIEGNDQLTDVRLISTLNTQNIDLDNTTFSTPPYEVTTAAGSTTIEWRFTNIAIDQIEDISYDVIMRGPQPGESRIITQKTDLYYTDINGNEVHTALGEQQVDVFSTTLQAEVSTDKLNYLSNESVNISAGITSRSDIDITANIRILVKDAAGALVDVAGEYNGVTIAPLQTWSPTGLVFETGSYYEGKYEAIIEVADVTASTSLSVTSPFLISAPADVQMSANVSTNKLGYDPYETVSIFDRIRNTTSNLLLESVAVTTEVITPGGSVFWSQSDSLSQLLPGTFRDIEHYVYLGNASPGTYKARLTVTDAQGVERALVEKVFTVRSTAETGTGLTGSLALTPENQVLLSETLEIEATVNNIGNTSLTDTPVSISIIDPVNHQVVANWDTVIADLAMQSDSLLTQSWPVTQGLGNSFIVTLSTHLGGQQKVLAKQTVTIQEKISSDIGVGQKGRLLVWLSNASSSSYESEYHDDEHHDDNHYEDDHYYHYYSDDQYSSASSLPPLAEQIAYLQGLLNTGWQYTIVTSRDDFLNELHRGGYSLYALIGEYFNISHHLEDGLTEAVNRGEGVLIAGLTDEPEEALGLDDIDDSYAYGITMGVSPLYAGGQLNFSQKRRVMKAELEGAEAIGQYLSSGSHEYEHDGHESYNRYTVTRFGYGTGRSVFIGFNLLAEAMAGATGNDFANMLLAALDDVHPADLPIREGTAVPIQLNLNNQGTATQGRVLLPIPMGSQVIDPGAGVLLDPQTLSLPYLLAANGSTSLEFWLQLPVDQATVQLTGQVQSGIEPDFIDHASVELTLMPVISPTLDAVLQQANNLYSSDSRCYKVVYYLQAAQTALAEQDINRAHRKLLEAADELEEISTAEARELRLQIDLLIRKLALGL